MSQSKGNLFEGLRFKLLGIHDEEFESLIKKEGGNIVRSFTFATHLIVNCQNIIVDEKLCSRARTKCITAVTELWVKHALRDHELPDPNMIIYRPKHDGKEVKNFAAKEFSTPPSKPQKRPMRNCKSTGNKKPRRDTLAIETPTAKKSLNFGLQKIPDEPISSEPTSPLEFASDVNNRVKYIHFPYSKHWEPVTKDKMKSFLLKSYREMLRLHLTGLSMDGKFTAIHFVRSGQLAAVSIQDIKKVNSTASNIAKDKRMFTLMAKSLFDDNTPPVDTLEWLKSIEKEWPEEVVVNHIYMSHSCSSVGLFQNMWHTLIFAEKFNSTAYKEIKEMLGHQDWKLKKFNWAELLENKDREDGKTKKPVFYADDGTGLIHLLRNMWEHPAKTHLEQFLAIVLNHNNEILADLQRALQKNGFLPQHSLDISM